MNALLLIDELLSSIDAFIVTANVANKWRIIDEETEFVGLFAEYKIGNSEDCDFNSFGESYGAGIEKISNHLTTNNIWKYFDKHSLDICPYPPTPNLNSTTIIGYFLNQTAEIKDLNLSQYANKEIQIKTLKPDKWFVYQHKGEYKNLPTQWNNAMKMIETKGYKIFGGHCFFEQYMDLDCTKVHPDDLITDIYIGLRD